MKISAAARNAAIKLANPKPARKKISFSGWWSSFKLKFRRSGITAQIHRSDERSGPKNGWLAVAVLASGLALVVLAIINYRLISDPSISGKAFQPKESLQVDEHGAIQGCVPGEGIVANNGPHKPPEVTFYQQLTAQDEQKAAQDSPTIQETELQGHKTGDSAVMPQKREDPKNKAQAKLNSSEDLRPLLPLVSTPGRYTVQVGAFTHPSIAQEWANKWKTRGYEVILRPVARPNTGIIYRLYLGNFPSEKQADDLVKHLKAKEGISALRLMVRN
ncbi:SPOR domain-containing protein [Desulfomonile tiedjei]|uniref:SPOR domain-containing protein n=1 Tax=Desulfomonile tiedjei TaxID=2358 RepID=UPI0012F8727E|nr:SPOR domain-containing protein [Desulfomonile tiedjei]